MLVVEVDGETHGENRAYDDARTRFLEERGYRVIRFTNSDVTQNLDGVLLTIAETLQIPLSPSEER